MATPAPIMTYNTDVDGICRRINRFIKEVFLSQSSGVSATITFDVTRIQNYVKAIRAYVAWSVAMPLLDLPETGPTAITMAANPILPVIENESLYDIAVMLELARDELVNSQSSRMSTNLIPFDRDRLIAIMDKIDNFILNYIQTNTPLDLPESSPMAPVSGPGATGV
jgi:hypothetical protein